MASFADIGIELADWADKRFSQKQVRDAILENTSDDTMRIICLLAGICKQMKALLVLMRTSKADESWDHPSYGMREGFFYAEEEARRDHNEQRYRAILERKAQEKKELRAKEQALLDKNSQLFLASVMACSQRCKEAYLSLSARNQELAQMVESVDALTLERLRELPCCRSTSKRKLIAFRQLCEQEKAQ